MAEETSNNSILEYRKLSWPEHRKCAKEGRVVLIPIGTLEDHGPHLPIDVDVVIPSTILRKVAERLPDKTLLFPEVVHGYSPHHMDFPGTTTLQYDQFIEYLKSITDALAHHGYKKIYMLNGHGSNQALCTIAQQETNRKHPDVVCMNAFYLNSDASLGLIAKIRKSRYPGGMGHACELETSLMLAIDPEQVHMENLSYAEMRYPKDEDAGLFMDWADGPQHYMPWWSEISKSGVQGDPTVASPETGKILLERAVDEAVKRVECIYRMPRGKREDRH